MKKKILSILCALIVLLSPVLFLVGCSADESEDVKITASKAWSVKVGGSFSTCTVGSDFKIEYAEKQWNSEAGEYQYVKAFGEDGKPSEFSEEKAVLTIDSLAEAIEKGLVCAGGFDSSTATTGTDTLTMELIFMGVRFNVQYAVSAT